MGSEPLKKKRKINKNESKEYKEDSPFPTTWNTSDDEIESDEKKQMSEIEIDEKSAEDEQCAKISIEDLLSMETVKISPIKKKKKKKKRKSKKKGEYNREQK